MNHILIDTLAREMAAASANMGLAPDEKITPAAVPDAALSYWRPIAMTAIDVCSAAAVAAVVRLSPHCTRIIGCDFEEAWEQAKEAILLDMHGVGRP